MTAATARVVLVVLGLLVVGRGEIQQADTITQAVVVTVTVSLVVHSLTAPLGIRMWTSHPAKMPTQANG